MKKTEFKREPQLLCENVSLGYEGRPVIEGLNFYVNSGHYLCIVGENGSGKSTLIKTLLRLRKPLSGNIRMGDGLRPQEIGYLPQQTAAQKDFPATVKEIVISGCLNRSGLNPFYTEAQKRQAQENMDKLGISHLKDRCYRELSGGQQQRVLLARALCATHKMLLLDEPVAGLDPKVTAEMYDIINSLNKNDGITVIMVTHDISALRYADHVLHISHMPAFFGTLEDYLTSEVGKIFAGGLEL
ncbi:MAG: ABC transporter ATP-binding protein [Clostridia bacterium]|nr:ABC transporter ATP-binding protein [Clostridia bacterium]